MKLTMTSGNSKLPRSTLNFSLPPIQACPGCTTGCAKHCYCLKAYKQYPNVKTAWDGNLNIIKNDLDLFKKESLLKIKKGRTTKQVRIHTSGDFINQEYLNSWIDVSKEQKNKIFYAYTKSTHLDFADRPRNFILIKSDDSSNGKVDKRFDGVARVFQKDEVVPKKWTVCPGDCKICNICYTKSRAFKRIAFKVH